MIGSQEISYDEMDKLTLAELRELGYVGTVAEALLEWGSEVYNLRLTNPDMSYQVGTFLKLLANAGYRVRIEATPNSRSITRPRTELPPAIEPY